MDRAGRCAAAASVRTSCVSMPKWFRSARPTSTSRRLPAALRDAGFAVDSSKGRHKLGSYFVQPSLEKRNSPRAGIDLAVAASHPGADPQPDLRAARQPCGTVFHPWEFVDMTGEPLRFDNRRAPASRRSSVCARRFASSSAAAPLSDASARSRSDRRRQRQRRRSTAHSSSKLLRRTGPRMPRTAGPAHPVQRRKRKLRQPGDHKNSAVIATPRRSAERTAERQQPDQVLRAEDLAGDHIDHEHRRLAAAPTSPSPLAGRAGPAPAAVCRLSRRPSSPQDQSGEELVQRRIKPASVFASGIRFDEPWDITTDALPGHSAWESPSRAAPVLSICSKPQAVIAGNQGTGRRKSVPAAKIPDGQRSQQGRQPPRVRRDAFRQPQQHIDRSRSAYRAAARPCSPPLRITSARPAPAVPSAPPKRWRTKRRHHRIKRWSRPFQTALPLPQQPQPALHGPTAPAGSNRRILAWQSHVAPPKRSAISVQNKTRNRSLLSPGRAAPAAA